METFIVVSPVGAYFVMDGEDALERAKAVGQVLANRDGNCTIWKAEKVVELQKEINLKEPS